MEGLRAYWELIKPRQTFAILCLFLLSVIASSPGKLVYLIGFGAIPLGVASVFISVAGSNALNCYLDRDIDLVMARTRRRPIPSGRVGESVAFMFSSLLIFLSLFLAFFLGQAAVLFLVVGLLSYIFAYTILSKRRNVLNVFANAPAIASPVWFGWIVGRGSLDFHGIFVGALVALWGPLHLWSLAIVFSKDYERAQIPMLPSTVGPRKARWHILVLSIMLASASYLLYFLGYNGLLYLGGITVLNLALVALSLRIFIDPIGKRCWRVYKFSAPYMVGLLLVVALDQLLIIH